MIKYYNHPLSELFPIFDSIELKKLAEDIKTNGLQSPIILWEGKILDGRNRYAACNIANVEPEFKEYEGNSPLQHIISLNLCRRHLSESQRAVIAGKIANMENGEMGLKVANSSEINQSANLRSSKISIDSAAKMMNVSSRAVDNARRIIREAPEKIKDIETGKKTVNKAMAEIKGGGKILKKNPRIKPSNPIRGLAQEIQTVTLNFPKHPESAADVLFLHFGEEWIINFIKYSILKRSLKI